MHDVREGYEYDAEFENASTIYWEPDGEDDLPSKPCVVVTGASVEDVKAGLEALRIARTRGIASGSLSGGGDMFFARTFDGHAPDPTSYGPSPAAAVLALAAMVEEGQDA